MSGPEDNPADEHQPTKEEWERIMGKDNQAPARPSEGAAVKRDAAILIERIAPKKCHCSNNVDEPCFFCQAQVLVERLRAADPRAAPDHTAIVNAARRVTTSMTKVEAGPGCYRITFPDSDAWMALVLALFNAPKDPP